MMVKCGVEFVGFAEAVLEIQRDNGWGTLFSTTLVSNRTLFQRLMSTLTVA